MSSWTGGLGRSFSITGSEITYAAGGGLSSVSNGRGDGGGISNTTGYAGGSGTVIIRYARP